MIQAMGVEIRCGVEVGKDLTIGQLREQGYKGFYVAIGCQGGRKAGSRARMRRASIRRWISCGKPVQRRPLLSEETWW